VIGRITLADRWTSCYRYCAMDNVLPAGSTVLSVPRTSLIGRETEIVMARALLLDETVPLLTLTGPSGVSKTRLALAIAHDMAAQFADGIVWVDLAPVGDPSRAFGKAAHNVSKGRASAITSPKKRRPDDY
jgi:predicted ATPase